MQLSLAHFGAITAGGLAVLGKMGESAQVLEETPEPIELDLSGDAQQEGARGLLHGAAEFLIISISGCEPKR